MEVPKAIGVPQTGWFIVDNPIKMDDLGVILGNHQMVMFYGCKLASFEWSDLLTYNI